MYNYLIILFLISIVFLILGIFIFKGNINLINHYHHHKVKESDRKKYCRAFSRALFIIPITLFTSGFIALFGENSLVVIISISVLFAGLSLSFIELIKVQKKFNR